MANQPASGVSYSADGKTLTVHGQTLNYVFTYTGAVPLQASDLAATEQRLTAAAPNPAPSFAAVQLSLASVLAGVTKLATQPAAGSMGPIALTQTSGTGGRLWMFWEQTNAADTAPTVTYNGAPVSVNNVQALLP